MSKMLTVVGVCISVISLPNVSHAKQLNPIFGKAVATQTSSKENKAVLGKGYYADYYGYYGNASAYNAYYYGTYSEYQTARAYAYDAYQNYNYAAYFKYYGQ